MHDAGATRRVIEGPDRIQSQLRARDDLEEIGAGNLAFPPAYFR